MINFIAIAKEIYRLRNWRELHRAVVFVLRACLHYGELSGLCRFFEADATRREIYARNKFPIEQATRAFFYKGSTVKERTRLIEAHYEILQASLDADAVRTLGQGGSIGLWQASDGGTPWRAVLGLAPGQRKEGMLAITMHLGRVELYQMIFWLARDKAGDPALFIGAMQGPNTENAKELVKEATKRAHRYRTKNLIFYMTQALARAIGVKKIYAVTNDGYYAQNHIRRDRKLKTDFSAFWQEAGGTPSADSRFYELPLAEMRKTMEEVPTRKRAVYRKRFAFQDDVDRQIAESMQKYAGGGRV